MLPDHAPLIFANDVDRRDLSRAAASGRLVRLAAGTYSDDIHRSPEEIVRARLWQIVGHEMPGAVIVDRSARDGGLGANGVLYVVADRVRPLALPGVTVVPRKGVGELPGDMALPDGIFLAGEARSLLENLVRSRRSGHGIPRRLRREELEAWLDSLCAARGPSGLNRLREQARELAPRLGCEKEFAMLDGLVSAALTTRDDVRTVSPVLRARASGQGFDQQRAAAFNRLTTTLLDLAPDVMPAMPADEDRRSLLPFYEAYFSNYIEGTEFTLDEAADIVFNHVVPSQRPKDAHDILGTFQLTEDVEEMRQTPQTPDELIAIVKRRHALVMGARPETSPGQFKARANRAGSTEFVPPELVDGTLRRGFELARPLTSPFARAVYLTFLVSEVHPFADGNGRIARLMMNAELVRAGEVRIIVPTVFRLNYLTALKAVTHTANDAALIATLSFARRWTARIDFSSRATAEAELLRTNALRDAKEAEDAGVRLQLP